MSKSLQEGDYEERVAAKSRPVRNFVSRSRAGMSTVPFSTAPASPGVLRSDSHRFGLIAGEGGQPSLTSTVRPVALSVASGSNKGDNVWNSQEWQTDARSITSMGKQLAWDSNQMQDSLMITGRPVAGDSVMGTQSLCRISFIHGNSEYQTADYDESLSRRQNGRH